MPSGCRRWFVVASQPKAERRAHAALHLKGYQPYLPLITVRLPNRHYKTGPLFPGYLFVNLDPAKPWYPIRYAPGVFCLLTVSEVPTPCPPGVVEAIQAGDELRSIPTPQQSLWRPGMPCSLAIGPFAGHHAVITQIGRDMATVAMVVFGALREVAVQLDCLTVRE